ncbi:MAG: hypothetical protein EA417_15670 [Gammaproteobacteria bacterium]|nr:MAG: hypothetical protein EA417_15670 [Gammaproteobacteria bacterium]
MTGVIVWTALATSLLVGVHLLAGRFHYLVGSRRSRVHSCLAGITTAYLFLKLLPELGAPGHVAGEASDSDARRLAFAIALLGFVVFYASEVWAHRHRATETIRREKERVYRLLLFTFALFNAGLAFVLPHQVATHGPWLTGIYVMAIGVHLLVLDHAVAEVHGGHYSTRARLIHSAGLVSGLVLAIALGPGAWEAAVQPLIAFLGGVIALQVFREEIPAYKQGRPLAFALGAAILAGLLLFAERLPH